LKKAQPSPAFSQDGQIPVCILFGPTASGKTALLEELFAISPYPIPVNVEIISADSMQVYRGMDIGTAKPDAELQRRIPHHLIDIRNPNEQFHVGDFVRLADAACAEIAARSALPVISGGTGFYVKNFIYGLSETPPSDQALRDALQQEFLQKGPVPLFEELERLDRESAAKIHRNDTYRLLRALEVCRGTGLPLSSFAQGNDLRSSYRFLIIGIRGKREELYHRIDRRCDEMFRRGLPAEVEALFQQGYTPRDPGMRAIGYREFFVETYDGEGEPAYTLSRDIEGVKTLVARNSRRYAKRQLTFFSSLPVSAGTAAQIVWLSMDEGREKTLDLLRSLLHTFLGLS
jgi:tRNA dimethylallyltransferase